jgi:hypothetical protein
VKARPPTARRGKLQPYSAISRLLAALLCLLAVVSAYAQGPPRAADEWQIKSAFLYNFTKFVEWPASSFAEPAQPIVIGILGEPQLAKQLQAVVASKIVNGRAIAVRTVRTAAEARQTQLLFVSAAEESRFTTIRPEILDSPVLTVGESASFSVTGAIGFVQDGAKLRFEINIDIAERAHLKISAQLQKLATTVRHSE